MKKILFAASEAVPFVKTGGLADVVGSLPKYFPKDEYDVRVILPKYLCMDSAYRERTKLLFECNVKLNWRVQYAGVHKLEEDGIIFYFIDNEYYFAGMSPYSEICYDAEKFAYFSKAVLTVLPKIGFWPDIIHCHDWQTGLIAVFLKAQFANDVRYSAIKTIFTIHNMKFQGRWYIDATKDVTGLDDSYFTEATLESYNSANFLKGGIVYSDWVTTVSGTYALEIQTKSGGEGLDGTLRARAECLTGIVNGIDEKVFNPYTDPLIEKRFDGDIREYKQKNKADLQKKAGLTNNDSVFLIGIVSRLTDQKGFDLLNSVLDELLSDGRIQLALLGTGEKKYEDSMRDFASRYQGCMSADICYSEDAAHRIYASSDALLMPSLFEPCGISQLIAMRYGTIPLVRKTGGLSDTVEPYDESTHTGTGFDFFDYDRHEILRMIRFALKIYTEYPKEWYDIAARGMKQDNSWHVSAGKYADIYNDLCERKQIVPTDSDDIL